jgi:hypothetical protein
MEKKLPTKQELEVQMNRTLLPLTEASNVLKMSNSTFNKLIERSFFPRDIYFLAGKDFRAEKRNEFLFCKESLQEYCDRFVSLEQIAKEMGHKKRNLELVIKNQLIQEGMEKIRLNHNRWDKKWFLENAPMFEHWESGEDSLVTELYLDLLGEEVKKTLERYLRHRTTVGSIDVGGQDYFRKLKSKESRLKEIKRELIRYLHKIHRGRLGIDLGYEHRRGKRLVRLSTTDREQLCQTPLDLYSIDVNDFVYLCENLDESTQFHIRQNLRPFLYFLLHEKWKDYRESLKLHLKSGTAFDSNKESQLLELHKIQFDELIKLLPKKYPEEMLLRQKVFGTREQVVRCIVSIRQSNFPGRGMSTPLKKAAMMGIGFFTAARPIEIWAMEIDKHLVIETNPKSPHFGFLKKFSIQVRNLSDYNQKAYYEETALDDKDGWGLMKITKNIAKGKYKGSPYEGTFIAPRMVDLVNEYLTWLYRQNPEARGKGFLFRPNPLKPYVQYTSPRAMTSWVDRWKKYFDFLAVDQQSYFRFYNTRHTCNNLIVNRTVYRQQFLNDARMRIGITHLRHDFHIGPLGFVQSSSNRKYQEAASEAIYFLGVKAALDFPFDLDELQKWEIDNNPFFDNESLTDNGLVMNDDFDDYDGDFDDYDGNLENTDVSNSYLQSADDDWTKENKKEIAGLIEERDQIQSQLNCLGNPHQALKVYGLKKADRLEALQKANQELIRLNNKIQSLGG